MIQLTCPYCRHEWSVGDPLGGSSVWCPQCGTPNDVPVPEPPSVSDSATVEGSAKGSRETIDFSEFLAPPVDSGELGRLGGYSVLRPIGIGGMGIVFEAEDVILKRRIALKVMRPDVARSDIARKQLSPRSGGRCQAQARSYFVDLPDRRGTQRPLFDHAASARGNARFTAQTRATTTDSGSRCHG